MGWDAFAITENNNVLFVWDQEHNPHFYVTDKVYARAFKLASEDVSMLGCSVDGLLKNDGLDCDKCGEAIQQLTGANAWNENKPILSIQEVQDLVINEYVPNDADRWAYYSALAFLKTCKEHKLGIQFSC